VTRNSTHGLFCFVIRTLALITVVLVVGFGTSLDAHGVVVGDVVAHTSVLVDEGHGVSHPAVETHAPATTHCGSGAVCFAALPPVPMLLSAPETGVARCAILNFALPSAPAFGLLRPPQHS